MVAERHGEMAEYMQRVGEQPVELSGEEHNLQSANAVGGRRATWRIIKSVDHEGETKGNEQQAAYAREYAVEVEAEVQKTCVGILALMEPHSLGKYRRADCVLLQDEGDHCRFLVEFVTGDAKPRWLWMYQGVAEAGVDDSGRLWRFHRCSALTISLMCQL